MARDPLFSVSFPDRRSCARVLRGRARIMLVVLGMLLGILPPLAAQEKPASPLSLAGTYTFLSDSDGGQAPGSVQISLAFGEGKAVLYSTPTNPPNNVPKHGILHIGKRGDQWTMEATTTIAASGM